MKCLAIVFLTMVCFPAHGKTVTVDPNACQKIPDFLVKASMKVVGPNWNGYRPYMCIYPIVFDRNAVSIYLLALDIVRAAAADSFVFRNGKRIPDNDAGGVFDPIPEPTIFDKTGKVLAVFPNDLPFPTLGPGTVSVSFSNWDNNFPHMFRLRVDDPTVTSPGWPYCPPAFVWNAKVGRYIEGKGDFYAKCR